MMARHTGRTRYQRSAMTAASVATLVCLIAWRFDPPALAAAWLGAWLFFVGIAVGALVIVMLHELTGGAWGFAIRRPLETAMSTLPVLAALALPLAFNLPNLYPWAHATAGKNADILLRKAAYLNVAFFDARAVIYFTVWIALAFALRRHWLRRETNAGDTPNARLRALSIAGLVLYAITATLAAVDWVMSLSAAWYSTAFGLLVMVSQAYSAFAFATACAYGRATCTLLPATREHTAGDLGNIVLTFAMLWAYLAFTQFLIIWAEDLPKEIDWYVARSSAFWKALAIAVLAPQICRAVRGDAVSLVQAGAASPRGSVRGTADRPGARDRLDDRAVVPSDETLAFRGRFRGLHGRRGLLDRGVPETLPCRSRPARACALATGGA